MSQAPYLTDAEIADICAPLVQASAQTRHLKAMGLLVRSKPNGRPLVARAEFDRAMITTTQATAANGTGAQPDRAALLMMFAKGKKSNGTQAQK